MLWARSLWRKLVETTMLAGAMDQMIERLVIDGSARKLASSLGNTIALKTVLGSGDEEINLVRRCVMTKPSTSFLTC
jgi:hypothetical protein